jgi:hypothetical protein
VLSRLPGAPVNYFRALEQSRGGEDRRGERASAHAPVAGGKLSSAAPSRSLGERRIRVHDARDGIDLLAAEDQRDQLGNRFADQVPRPSLWPRAGTSTSRASPRAHRPALVEL